MVNPLPTFTRSLALWVNPRVLENAKVQGILLALINPWDKTVSQDRWGKEIFFKPQRNGSPKAKTIEKNLLLKPHVPEGSLVLPCLQCVGHGWLR